MLTCICRELQKRKYTNIFLAASKKTSKKLAVDSFRLEFNFIAREVNPNLMTSKSVKIII